MWIALIIVAGLVLMTGVASGFDYMGKRKLKTGEDLEKRLAAMEQKLALIEDAGREKDAKIEQLGTDLSFMHKLLEDKSK
jgi:hypothetical protein